MPDPDQPIDLHFIVTLHSDDHGAASKYLRAEIKAVNVEDGHIRNFSYMDHGDRGAWADLQVSAQMDNQTGFFYGRKIEYFNVYSVSLMHAERMVKTLRSLHRKLERLDAKLGTAEDLAGFAARVTVAAGVTAERPFIVQTKAPVRFGGYDEGEYRYLDADSLRHHLDTKVQEWREKYGIKLETA